MNNKIFFLIFSLLLFINLSSAEVQTLPNPIKTGSCVNLPQLYGNSSFQNITAIQIPNQSLIILDAPMTNSKPGYFNYTFCNTTQNGNYIVNGIGDTDGVTQGWNYAFEVNPIGKVFTTAQAILYFIALTIAFIFFLICLTLGIYAPYDNRRNEMTGYIIAVENLKYVKIFMLFTSYLLVLLMMYLGWMLSYGYLDLDFLGSLFQFTFYFFALALVPIFVVGIYVIIMNWVRDSKVADLLIRGIRTR